MHLLRNKLVKSDFFSFSLLPKGQWAVAYVCTTNYHKLILMQATAERAMGGGFRRNSDSELKLKNRCTGSTLDLVLNWLNCIIFHHKTLTVNGEKWNSNNITEF